MVTPPPDGSVESIEVDVRLDERGRVCPLPVIALGKAAASAPGGAVIALLSDDAAAAYDIPAWCSMRGADYLGSIDRGDHAEYIVRTANSEPANSEPADSEPADSDPKERIDD